MQNNVEEILTALKQLRLGRAIDEADIHAEIARVLTEGGIGFQHEYRAAPRCRPDFFCSGTAIEVKKSRPEPGRLKKQIEGYLLQDCVTAIIVVTQHQVRLPDMLCGKPIYQLSLDRLWGVSLP